MALPHKIVLLDDPYNRPEDGPHMEFRLTYNGPLSSGRNEPMPHQRDSRADHKHCLRKRFHKQLKRLWEITPYLRNDGGIVHLRSKQHRDVNTGALIFGENHDIETLARKHAMYGFNFVPLVTFDMDVLCGLDVLFLRPDKPGGVVWAGDIDNRIKTLIDALRIPDPNEKYIDRKAEQDEQPFFCLLQDDKLVSKLSVETDQLLEFDSPGNMNEVRLIITVRIRPYQLHIGNLELGG
jgi:hypothetical protein